MKPLQTPDSKLRRILMVAPRYFPYMGGVETHVFEVARRLVKYGIEVTVLSTDPSNNLLRQEVVQGVNILRVRPWIMRGDLYFAPAIYRVIRETQCDIIHCQGFHTLVPPIAMLAAQRAAIPYVLTFHSGGHSSGLRNRIRGLQSKLQRPLLAGARQLIAVSNFETDLFIKRLNLSREHFTVIPNGSNLPKVTPPPPTEEGPTILSVGRLERYKGHHRVIAAFPKVLEKFPQACLRIIGSGPYERELQNMARESPGADRIQIGSIASANRQEMATVLSQASLVVLFSEYEAHPISVMEALSLRRPVLVADTSGLHELAEQGLVHAIPINSSDSEMAEAIKDQLRSPLVASIQLPTWDSCVSSLLELYVQVLEKQR